MQVGVKSNSKSGAITGNYGIGSVIHQVALGWTSSEPPKIEQLLVQNSEFSRSMRPTFFTFFVPSGEL
jgi:hypothetical protein